MTRPPRRIRSLTKPSSFLSFDSVHAAAAARKGLLTRESRMPPSVSPRLIHAAPECGPIVYGNILRYKGGD